MTSLPYLTALLIAATALLRVEDIPGCRGRSGSDLQVINTRHLQPSGVIHARSWGAGGMKACNPSISITTIISITPPTLPPNCCSFDELLLLLGLTVMRERSKQLSAWLLPGSRSCDGQVVVHRTARRLLGA